MPQLPASQWEVAAPSEHYRKLMYRFWLTLILFSVLAACSNAEKQPRRQPAASAPSQSLRTSWTPSSWRNYQWNDQNNAVFPGTLSVQWSLDTGGKINGSLAVVQNHIYVNSFSKKVFAVDLTSGKTVWSADVPEIVMSTPIVSDGLVIVGTGTNDVLSDSGAKTIWGTARGNDVIALDQNTGKTVWKFHTVGEDMPTPAVLGDRLVFSNGDMHAYALDLKTGRVLWKVPMPGVTTMSATTFSNGLAFLVASHGLDYIFSDDASHMIAIDVRNGHVVWSSKHGNADCSPTVADNLVVCEGSTYEWYGHNALGWMGRSDVEAFDTRTGRLAWRWIGDLGYYTAVGSSERGIAGMVHDHVLFQSVPTSNEMVAFRMKDGKPIWRFRTAGAVKMSPLFWKGKIIFGDTEGLLYAVDAATGKIYNLIADNNPFTTSAPVIVGKTLFIASGATLKAIPLDHFAM